MVASLLGFAALLGFSPRPQPPSSYDYDYDSYDPGPVDSNRSQQLGQFVNGSTQRLARSASGGSQPPAHCLTFDDVAEKWFQAYEQLASDDGHDVCVNNRLRKDMKKMCLPALAIAVSESYDIGQCTISAGAPFDSSACNGGTMCGVWQIVGCYQPLCLPGFTADVPNPPDVATHAKAIYTHLTSSEPNWGCNGEYSGKLTSATIPGIRQKQRLDGSKGHRFCAGAWTGGNYKNNVLNRVDGKFKTLKKACNRALKRVLRSSQC
mmetsp:Transcript_17712/g.52152  ORF Transcript_17712/g.52152 Transcript_17712/m.52152 type:complete len:264 (-) Transcript_17712:141-932(-)